MTHVKITTTSLGNFQQAWQLSLCHIDLSEWRFHDEYYDFL
jgi:hypothetical protein